MVSGRFTVTSRAQSSTQLAALIDRHLIHPTDRTAACLWSIVAPPGMGKTHFLDQVVAGLDAGTDVRRAEADELSSRVPLAMVDTLLRRATASPITSMSDALAELDALCSRRPLLLVVDDAHLVDQESLTFLHHAADAALDLPLVVLLARRSSPRRRRIGVLESLVGSATVELAALNESEMVELVHRKLGVPPDRRLRTLINTLGGNPFHAHALLTDLERGGALVRTVSARGHILIDADTDTDHVRIATSMSAALRENMDQLDHPARAVADTVAVWGEAMPVSDLALVRHISAVQAVEQAQLAVDSGILRWASASTVEFHHRLYRDVVSSQLSDPVRHVLHAACADALTHTHSAATKVARHDALSSEYGRHYHASIGPRTNTAHAVGSHSAAGWTTTTERAAALAQSGALVEASRVAAEALRTAVDPQQRGTLRGIQISALVAAARVSDAVGAIDESLGAALPPERRDWLLALRRWIVLLDGRDSLRTDLTVYPSMSATELVEIGVTECLRGGCLRGIDILDRAVESGLAGAVGSDGATGPVWPVWARLIAEGPLSAGRWHDEYHRVAHVDGWLDPYLGFVTAGIAFRAGRWDDAAVGWDSALQGAARNGSGWISMAFAPRSALYVARGELDRAATGLASWNDDPKPDQFGLPDIDVARADLAAARGDHHEALRLHRSAWSRALNSGRVLWAVMTGIDAARTALLNNDEEFIALVERDLSSMGRADCPLAGPVLDLVAAMRSGDLARALGAVDDFDAAGDVVFATLAREEAACIAVRTGDRALARRTAAAALAVAADLGAVTLSIRVATRLRRDGLRLGVSGARSRPVSGWESLTPTERSIADLIAVGMSGPDIAAQLHVSPRTVQTHVSRVLGKLGLRTRVEIAALAAKLDRGSASAQVLSTSIQLAPPK